MHETDMTKALIMTVKDWLAEQPKQRIVERVHLTVGEFTCVEPQSLQFAFAAQTKGTFLEGVVLVIEETPLIAFCHACDREYRPDIGSQYACPTCHGPMDDIRSGRELRIGRVEFSQTARMA
ncbi:MAG: hydrogenase maturation nickel metallochaperone HypA [Cyanobacteria bacterium J06623_5]